MTTTIKQSTSSAFYGLIHQEPVKIWAWCGNCWDRTHQAFHHEDDRMEYYECETCHKLHGVAVR